MRILSLLATCLLPLGMANCAASPLGAIAVPAMAPAETLPLDDPRYRHGLLAFRSNDSDGNGWVWSNDEFADWVLASATLVDGQGRETIWFIRLSTAAPDGDAAPAVEEFTVPAQFGSLRRGTKISAPANQVLIELFGREGNLIHSIHRTLPGGFAESDFLEALGRAVSDSPSREASEELAKLAISIGEVGRSSALRPIRREARSVVIREPSILVLILNAFRLHLRADFSNVESLTAPWLLLPAVAELPQYLARSPILFAGQHVVNFQIVLAPPNETLALTAGVLGFEMSHPEQPRQRLTVKLLATKPR